MKRLIKHLETKLIKQNTIHITMYLRPEIYTSSQFIRGSIYWDKAKHKYYSDNTSRRINGPLSDYGQELEPPIQEEYDHFIEDCVELIEEFGFVIIDRHRSTDSKKSEYILLFGMESTPCGSIVYELRISDHPLDVTFPEEFKQEALEYLKMNKVLDGSASKAGINFRVEKILIGQVTDDTWDRALDRLFNRLKQMKKRIQNILKTQGEL